MARTRYTDAQRAEALAMYAEMGPAETSRQTGIAKGTLASWASRAGIATNAAVNIRAAVEVAAARRTFVAEEFRASMVERLAKIAETASDVELQRLAGSKASLHEIVGSRTRAIHDLQLLRGDPTTRTETIASDSFEREIERLFEQADT